MVAPTTARENSPPLITAETIIRGAQFLIDDMWDKEADGFHYTSCPKSEVSPSDIGQILGGIAYAWREGALEWS